MSRCNYQQADNLFLAALAALPGLGPKRLRKIRSHFESWQAAWEATEAEWRSERLPQISITAWQKRQKTFSPEKLRAYLAESGTCLLTADQPDYPSGFKDLNDAPVLLYARGNGPKTRRIITVIGSRQPTPYGEAAAEKLVPPLARADYSLASGLALGLDSLVHRLCLQAGGHTIAILGSGLDHIYPSNNKKLAAEIITRHGWILSEYPPTAPPLKANFIQRNRLLAAIAETTLVLEAGLASGSIRTARSAQELGRRVYAVPGNIFNNRAAGCHRLIQEGAGLATAPAEIAVLATAKMVENDFKKSTLSPDEIAILDFLSIKNSEFAGANADEIGSATKLDTASVNSTLSILEIRNLIRRHQGRYYLRRRESENCCDK